MIELPAPLRDKFQIDAPLGAGAIGQVYLATQLALDRRVALKLIPLDQDIDSARIGQIEREGVALARLNHPHILTVFESGTIDGLYFLATELADGSLGPELPNIRQSDVLYRVQLALQMVSAVAAAHMTGIIHRDIKPENTLVLRRQGATTLKLADFGLARMARVEPEASYRTADSLGVLVSRSGKLAGTPAYMAPECWSGTPQSTASDVFAAGVVLFQLFSGVHPFPADDVPRQRDRIIRTEPPSLLDLDPALPRGVASIVAAMLAKKPDQRPSAAEVDAQLAASISPFRVHGASTPAYNSEELPADVREAIRRPGSRIGRYICVGRAALSGAAEVLRGWDPVLADYVFIKRVRLNPAGDWVRRNLLSEARAMARIRHPAVLRPRDIVEDQGSYNVIYDHQEGEWLSFALHGHQEVSGPHKTAFHEQPDRFIDLILQLADGLAAAHACIPCLVNGDIKPSTVLVTPKSLAVLTSFEVVLESGVERSLVRTPIRGSVAYSPPELLLGMHDRIGPFSDVFCLGSILYEMLSGVPPGATIGEFQRPSSLLPTLPDELHSVEEVCMRALALRPVDRFQSMDEFSTALRRR